MPSPVMAANPRVDRRNEELRRWVDGLIVSAQNRNWYGVIEITIKNGVVELAAAKETFKPPPPGG